MRLAGVAAGSQSPSPPGPTAPAPRPSRPPTGTRPLRRVAPSNTSGHQKWNGTADSLKASPTMHHQPAEDQHHRSIGPTAAVASNVGQPRGHRRQVGRAEHAGQQADAVEHDARRAGAVDGVLQRRLAARAAALEHAGQGVGRARWPSRRPGRPSACGWPRPSGTCPAWRPAPARRTRALSSRSGTPESQRENQKQHGEQQQHRAEVDREPVVDQHAGEDLAAGPPRRLLPRRGEVQRRPPSRPARSRTSRAASAQRGNRRQQHQPRSWRRAPAPA